MKNSGTNKKILTFIQNNYKLLILFFSLSLLNIILLCWNFKSNNLNFGETFVFTLIGSILLEIILGAIILISQRKKWKTEKIFLILSLVIGVVYVFVLPIGRAPDEASHFFRIYELSTGHFVSDTSENGIIGTTEPSNIQIVNNFKENNVTYTEIINNLNLHPEEKDLAFIPTSAYSYNLFSYLPHTIGMFIGNSLGLPLLVTAYLAKLFNLVTCVLILYLCIKFIPFLKKIIFFLGFLPTTMQAMASLSPDGLAIASSVALISFVLYSIYSCKKNFSKKQIGLLFIICLFLSMSKIAYAPVCLLLFAIPKERFGSNKRKIITIIAMGCIIFAALLAWLFIAPSIQSAYDSTAQISTIISNPPKYMAIVFHSISTNLTLYVSGFFGKYLEWFNVVLSPLYVMATFVIFILLCNKEQQTNTITKTAKLLSILIFIIVTMITFTTMFIQWTKTGETIIDGVQGRYFLPIILLIPIGFLSTQKHPKKIFTKTLTQKSQNYYLYSFLVFQSIYAITTIACTHI